MNQKIVVSYGSGTNSTAMLIGMYERVDLVKYDDAQMDIFKQSTEIPCECFDGE